MYENSSPYDSFTAEPVVEEAAPENGRQADPYDVINFLLKKAEEQNTRITEQDGFIELQHQELEQLKAQLETARQELEAQMADYEILMQNTLAAERELESHRLRATAKPTINLPVFTEQKLAKLGYEPIQLEDRLAV